MVIGVTVRANLCVRPIDNGIPGLIHENVG